MTYAAPSSIKLTKSEKALAARIEFDAARLSRSEAIKSGEAALALAELLRKRKVIPDVRVRYFIDPAFHVGGSCSRKEVFERNGTTGDDIYRHPHFLQHLKYFINGPDLPPSTIAGFCKLADDDLGTSGEMLDQLKRFARAEVRRQTLDRRRAAEEFFKLAHELGLDEHFCRTVRDAAMQTR